LLIGARTLGSQCLLAAAARKIWATNYMAANWLREARGKQCEYLWLPAVSAH